MQADRKLWRVRVRQEREVDIFAVAATADEAAEAVKLEFEDSWYGLEDSGPSFFPLSKPVTEAPFGYANDIIVNPEGPEFTVASWLESDAERRAEAERTPGTPEYRAAVEAAGQLTLDALAGEGKP